MSEIGKATQFFYAAADDCDYKMLAMFFLADFPDEPKGQAEHELFWLPLGEAAKPSSTSAVLGQLVKNW